MDNLLPVEIGQAVQNSFGHFSKDLFSCPASKLLDLSIDTFQAPSLTKLHCDGDCTSPLIDKSAVVSADIFRSTLFIKTEFSHNLLLDIRVGIGSDNLFVLVQSPVTQLLHSLSVQTRSCLPSEYIS